MGKGLSELQKRILVLAYQNHSKESRPEPGTAVLGADLYKNEVLAQVFDLPLQSDIRTPGGERDPAGWHFSKRALGQKYNAAQASVARAFRRLEDRELAVRLVGSVSGWSGIDLTDEGLRVAEKLTVNISSNSSTE
jgi:hypothetical protein